MLSHPLEDEDFAKLDAADFVGEWKWDGIRLQAVAGRASDGRPVRRIYSRTGEDVSRRLSRSRRGARLSRAPSTANC